MAVVPNGVIYIWTGNHADIPAGWERVTALDDKYPKGTANATDPNDTGGSATHSHSASANHSHSANSHTHSITLGVAAGAGGAAGAGSDLADDSHVHSSPFNTSGMSGGNLSSVSSTYASVSNDPPYYEVIYITPTSGVGGIPNETVYLYDDTDSKSNHYICNGSNSTPNLSGRFLKGAGTESNAGSTGGSATNIHTLSHTHVVSSHYHTRTTPATEALCNAGSGNNNNVLPHTHSITTNSTTDTLAANPSLTTSETVEPAHTRLLAVQNRTGALDRREGMIGLWLGTLADIPSNYDLCDGTNSTVDMRGRHLKATQNTAVIGDTGGSNTHTHASQSHTHTASGTHTHTSSEPSHTGQSSLKDDTSTGCDPTVGGTSHSISLSNATVTYTSSSTSADSANNEPEYRTVAFVKYEPNYIPKVAFIT